MAEEGWEPKEAQNVLLHLVLTAHPAAASLWSVEEMVLQWGVGDGRACSLCNKEMTCHKLLLTAMGQD